jgi:hypothetical protein
MPTFIDNVTIQVTERSIVQGLEEVFDASNVGMWSNDEVARIATESEEGAARRSRLEKLRDGLEEANDEITALMNMHVGRQFHPQPRQIIPSDSQGV